MLEEVCNRWKDIGEKIGLPNSSTQAIEQRVYWIIKNAAGMCSITRMQQGKNEDCYPPSWNGLLKLLHELKINSLVEHL